MHLKKLLAAFMLLPILFSCKTGENKNLISDTVLIEGHPAWILQGNIYEVNVRQYTPEGTFKAFEKHLDRLKEMGVQTLWFMPITPIGVVDRKGILGSYYAVKDYTAVNPEFGTIEDWKSLVAKCHKMGFKVIIDWVANHTAADHHWIYSHPDFFVTDKKTGKILSPFDWTDTRKLNYENVAMQDSMIAAMQFWVKETGIDGFRCDVAEEVPESFWARAISTLRKDKKVFMLAEGNKPWLHKAGFDESYTWDVFHVMTKIVKAEKTVSSLDSAINYVDTAFPKNTLRMYFTSNHDENSWNKADYGTTPNETHAPFAVLTQTMAKSVPLIYSGQEEPFLDSLSFFYKDTITFGKFGRAGFYKTLLNLRKNNTALAANASFKRVNAGNPQSVFAYVRENGKDKILVILNLSKQPQKINIADKTLHGKPYNVFMGSAEPLEAKDWEIEPWGYVVYEYK